VRWRWKPNSMAIWDNRSTQHYAVMDYAPCHRKMERAGIVGDKPYGVGGKPQGAEKKTAPAREAALAV
jgi:taurine dioxygenase